MKELTMLDILTRLKTFIEKDERFEAKEYVKLEIENLKGITPIKCTNNMYAYNWYCDKCSITNCSNNKNYNGDSI